MLAVAAAAVLILAAYAAGTTAWRNAAHSGDPIVTSFAQWRHPSGPETIADWPTAGNLAGGRPLLRSAAAGYRAAEGMSAGSPVKVLYAGDLSEVGPYIVLAADYGDDDLPPPDDPVDAYQPGQAIRHLGAFASFDNGPYLVPLPGNRLLVPPWRTGLRLTWLTGGGSIPSSRTLPVAEGIATIPAAPGNVNTCFGRIAAIQYRDTTDGQSNAYTGTVIVAPEAGTLSPWPAVVMGDTGTENVSEVLLRALGDLTCGFSSVSVDWLYQGTYQLQATDLGEETVPGLGLVAAITFQAQDVTLRTPILAEDSAFDGGQSEFIQLGAGATVATGAVTDPTLTGAWWHDGTKGWYLLAAGASTFHVVSTGITLNVIRRSGSFAIFSAGNGPPAALGPVLLWTISEGIIHATTVKPST